MCYGERLAGTTRLRHPWDSPGKNTGVGCHFLLQCMKVKREREVAQSCPTPSDPTDCIVCREFGYLVKQREKQSRADGFV